MSTAVTVTTEADKLLVTSPFHPGFSPKARALQGRWSAAQKSWSFDARDEARVRALLVDLFGTDGSGAAADGPTVDVRVDLSELTERRAAGSTRTVRQFRLAGRLVAERRSRDADVVLGQDVVLISGSFWPNGGSVANPIIGPSNAVIEMRDLSMDVAERVLAEADGHAQIVSGQAAQLAALTAERDRLIAALAAIEAQIAAAQSAA